MCESCVPTCSVPLRVSTAGNELGTVTLLIDNDELATVIRVEVGAAELIKRVNDEWGRHRIDLADREERALGKRMVMGRQVPQFAPTHRIIRWGSRELPREVWGFPVEVLDREVDEGIVIIMLPNGYTQSVNKYLIEPIPEEAGQ